MPSKGKNKIAKEAIELVEKLGIMPANVLTPDQMVVEAKALHKDIKQRAK